MSRRCPRCNCWRGRGRCKGCAQRALRRSQVKPGEHRCHGCGAPTPADHSRCPACRTGRRTGDHAYRRALANAALPEDVRDDVLTELAAGLPLAEVCEEYEVTSQQLFGWRVYAPEWGDALDAALMAGRNPNLKHGTKGAYRHGKCRCPECRAAKGAAPVWWRQRRRAA